MVRDHTVRFSVGYLRLFTSGVSRAGKVVSLVTLVPIMVWSARITTRVLKVVAVCLPGYLGTL